MKVTSISASDPERRYPLGEPIRQAWAELGVALDADADGGSVSGIAEFYENSKNGERQPSYLAYPVSLPGIEVLTEALVARILFKGTSASGVELADGTRFESHREVVLCAGALRTPQILLPSGIGPSATLK